MIWALDLIINMHQYLFIWVFLSKLFHCEITLLFKQTHLLGSHTELGLHPHRANHDMSVKFDLYILIHQDTVGEIVLFDLVLVDKTTLSEPSFEHFVMVRIFCTYLVGATGASINTHVEHACQATVFFSLICVEN